MDPHLSAWRGLPDIAGEKILATVLAKVDADRGIGRTVPVDSTVSEHTSTKPEHTG
ncbi:hypothetical protein [Streptomyces sp. NPDC001450]